MATHLKPLAALLPAFFAVSPVHAQQAASLDTVVVTATRFDETDDTSAANVTVISREDIESSGAQTLPDVLKYQAGLNVMPLYGSIGADTSIDMRGFGEGASSRTLVLLNGQRLNSLDSISVDWGLVPLDSVERVEIIHGSGSVLYGDNAVGGVINIITDREPDGAHARVGAGSRNGRQVSAGFANRSDAIDVNLSVNHQDTDGWRRNNEQDRDNASGRLGVAFDKGSAFVDVGWSDLKIGLPGSLTKEQFRSDPRQAQTLDSYSKRNNAFLRPGIEWQLTDALKFAAEIGYSDSESTFFTSNFCAFSSCFEVRKTNVLSFTPRFQLRHGLGSLPSRTTFGLDYYDGMLTADKSPNDNGPVVKTVRIDQSSWASYLQNQTDLSSGLVLTVGARYQKIDQSASDSTGFEFSNDHDKFIGELGLSYRLAAGARLFSRIGSTFRNPNLDELTTFAGFVSKPVRPEQGTFVDLGVEWSATSYALKAAIYDLEMKDEIAFNSLTFENENLARTRHRGVEVNGRYRLDRQWQLVGGIHLQKAEFREGVDSGKRIPLVPATKINVGVTFEPLPDVALSLVSNYVGSRFFGGDTGNREERLAAYTVADFVASWRHSNWAVRARVLNLTDRKYSPFGFFGSYYPADGRSFFVDLRYDF
ncbi:MAG TPA: TonB-dependent receptor [Zeimonas sp.]